MFLLQKTSRSERTTPKRMLLSLLGGTVQGLSIHHLYNPMCSLRIDGLRESDNI